jgi:hypothetical protein
MSGYDTKRHDCVSTIVVVAFVALVAVVADCAVHAAAAQGTLFSSQRNGLPAPQSTGLVGWLLQKQSDFYRQISSTIRAAKTDGSAIWTLIGISFAYGVFHAAGPGHGKAVISSYLIANKETAPRGVTLSFASAFLQSSVAVVLVGLGRLVFNATASTMCDAERAIEIASYGLIAAVGAGLVWTKGRVFLNAILGRQSGPASFAPSLASRARTTSSHPFMNTIKDTVSTSISTITIRTTSMTSTAATITARRQASSPVPEVGGAVWAQLSRPGYGLAQGQFWFLFSHSRKRYTAPASPPPLLWDLARQSQSQQLRPSQLAPKVLRSDC